jgi:hypothetical protein
LEKASQDVNDERQNVAVENLIEKNEKQPGTGIRMKLAYTRTVQVLR